jgi:redox-sensitive bicupin YhaK (pirin superfamily)
MIKLRKSQDRGYADHGWLKSYHSFSFAGYQDPAHMAWGNLRVINEDRVAPGMGFGEHSHRDMEIISYVLEGQLAHKDSTGTESAIGRGDVQRMSAGSGVVHSEFNPSRTEGVHFLQIWIQPNVLGIEPSYEEKRFDDKRGRLQQIASPDRAEGSVLIHQDARVYAGLIDGVESARLALQPDRRLYLHVARGRVTANGALLNAGDALKLDGVPELALENGIQAEVIVFDLPGPDDRKN